MPRRATAVVDEAPRERMPDEYKLIQFDFLQENAWNPRRHHDDAKHQELTASIREKGILEPMIVRPVDDGLVEVVAGCRRFRAAKAAGLTEAHCVVKDLTDAEALEVALSENLNRHDMHPLDEAEAYATLQRTDKRVYTVGAIARRTGQTESHVYRRLKLLELEKDLRAALAEDRLSIGHAEKLLRLPVTLRKAAAHHENGVVWRRSPLLDYGEDWIPGRDDLRPLAELEHFIRSKSAFDPTSEDTKHFQPELAAEIAQPAEPVLSEDTEAEVERDIDEAMSTMVLLSEDPLARTKLGAGKKDTIPLTPSKWREVPEGKRCEWTVRGVVAHGGPARVLDVCTKRSCPVHWPEAKKKKPTAATATPSSRKDEWEKEASRQKAEREAWTALSEVAAPAFAAHVAKIKFSAALVREVVGSHSIARVKQDFGVTLTDKTAAQFLACHAVRTYNRGEFLRSVKPFKFNLGAVESKLKAEHKKAEAKNAKADAKGTGQRAKAKGRKNGKAAA